MKHVVHVTNYQQYIDASPLVEAVLENIPPEVDDQIKAPMYLSIAYLTINKTHDPRRLYETVLAVSVSGKSYRYRYAHGQKELYDAMNAIVANDYKGDVALKDDHIRSLQATFETLIFLRVDKMVNALLKAYNIKTV